MPGKHGKAQATHDIKHQLTLHRRKHSVGAQAAVSAALLRVHVENGTDVYLGRASAASIIRPSKRNRTAHCTGMPVAHSSVQLGAVLKGLIAYKHVVLEREAKLAALQRQHDLVQTRATVWQCKADLKEGGVAVWQSFIISVRQPA